jgi:hypothetical protein
MCVVEAAVPQSLWDVVRVPATALEVGVVTGVAASRRELVSDSSDPISRCGGQPNDRRLGGVVMLRLHTSPFLP